MSAFLVQPEHIGAIVAFHARGLYIDNSPSRLKQRATLLAEANIRSIEARYPDTQAQGAARGFLSMPDLEYIKACVRLGSGQPPAELKAVDILAMCACLEYQSCEFEDWNNSKAHELLNEILVSVIRRLPGYDDAPWDYSARRAA